MMTKDDFLLQCSSYQKGHNRITLVFIILLLAQVTVFNTFSLWDTLRGWPVFALAGLELAVFISAIKIHDNRRGVRCPYCGKRLGYGFGPTAVRRGRCPHCRSPLFQS